MDNLIRNSSLEVSFKRQIGMEIKEGRGLLETAIRQNTSKS